MLIYSPASLSFPYFRRRRLSLSLPLSLLKFEERRRQKEREEEEEKTLLGASLPPRFGAKNLEAFVEGEDRLWRGGERSWNSYAQNMLNNYSIPVKRVPKF